MASDPYSDVSKCQKEGGCSNCTELANALKIRSLKKQDGCNFLQRLLLMLLSGAAGSRGARAVTKVAEPILQAKGLAGGTPRLAAWLGSMEEHGLRTVGFTAPRGTG